MPLSAEEQDRVERIFFPHEQTQKEVVMNAGCRFVYYTSAAVATSILKHQQFWMRNTATMNDYSEVVHGFECLNAAYKSDCPGKKFRATLNACFPGLGEEIEAQFNGWWPEIRTGSYITCVSEHVAEEDQNGRLSMWRAYGGSAGVALVFNGEVMFREAHALGAYAYPVAYLPPDAFLARFRNISDEMHKQADFLKTLDRISVKNTVFNMLRSAVLCTKHPGFHEEREWRVVASPAMYPSKLLQQAVEVVNGVPQIVLKLDLKNHADQGVTGLTLPELLNRIIIGPCESPNVIRKAFLQLLKAAEVPKPEDKIVVSAIPLRPLK